MINIALIFAVISSMKGYVDKINRGEINQPIESENEDDLQQDMGEKLLEIAKTFDIEMILKIVLLIIGIILSIVGVIIVIKI